MKSSEVTLFTIFSVTKPQETWLSHRECPKCLKEMHYQDHNQKFVCNNEEGCLNYDNPEPANITEECGDVYIR